MSELKSNIIAALELYPEGLTRDEIIASIGSDNGDVNPRMSVGISLGYLCSRGKVIKTGDKYSLATARKKPAQPVNDAAFTAARVQLTEQAKSRPGATVAIYQSPVEIDGIVKIQLLANGVWFSLPYAAGVRICVGPGIPQWSENQETTRGITRIRLVKRSGEAVEYETSASFPITIDYV